MEENDRKRIGLGGLLFSYYPKTAYHDSCVPADKRAQQVPTEASGKKYTEGDFSKCDNVAQDTIWKQSVTKEQKCLKNWEENWGFLTQYDEKDDAGFSLKGLVNGNQKEVEQLPEKISIFSDAVPNTNSGNYGARINTEIGATIGQLEKQFYSKQKRKKMGNDLVCY